MRSYALSESCYVVAVTGWLHPDTQEGARKMVSDGNDWKFGWTEALGLFGLGTLALAHPVLGSLGSAATFFVAHNIPPIGLAIFAIGVTLIPAFVASLLIATSQRVGFAHVAQWLFVLSLAIFGATFALSILAHIGWTESRIGAYLALLTSGLAGLWIAWMYPREELIRQGLGFSSIAIVAVPMFFLLGTPVASLMRGEPPIAEAARIEVETPVVVILFDEFNPFVLFDPEGEVDGNRFPNFRSLADDSLWFSDAAASNVQSFRAVPSVLTGQLPVTGYELPILANYPNNIFTLLGGQYALNVHDNFTALCPEAYCGSDEISRIDLGTFGSDLAVILQHTYYPRYFAASLPRLDTGWKNFQSPPDTVVELPPDLTPNQRRARIKAVNRVRNDNVNGVNDAKAFRNFVDGFRPGQKTLDFLHVIFPHTPFERVPDGRLYNGEAVKRIHTPAEQETEILRYIWQVAFADLLLGEAVQSLKELGKYEDALVIVTADHGIGFDITGRGRRWEDRDGTYSALHIPMFVKLPQSRIKGRSSLPVSNMDIVPTIADALSIPLPWETAGASVLSDDYSPPPRIAFSVGDKDLDVDRRMTSPPDLVGLVHKWFPSEVPVEGLRATSRLHWAGAEPITKFADVIASNPNSYSMRLLSDEIRDFDPDSAYVPIHVKGELIAHDRGGLDHVVTVFNGRVAAATRIFGDEPIVEINAYLPPSDFRRGDNTLEFFLASAGDGEFDRLIPLSDGDQIEIDRTTQRDLDLRSGTSEVEFRASDGAFMEGRDAQTFRIKKKPHRSHTIIRTLSDRKVFMGWSVDAVSMQSPDFAVLMRDGEVLLASPIDQESEDVATLLEDGRASRARFKTNLPLDFDDSGDLTVVFVDFSSEEAVIADVVMR